jgi:hypothetical protein
VIGAVAAGIRGGLNGYDADQVGAVVPTDNLTMDRMAAIV